MGRRPALALVDRHLEGAEPLLLFAVIVMGALIPRLHPRLDESAHQRVVALATRHMQRAVLATPAWVAAMAGIVPVLHALEIGQHIRVAPAVAALIAPVVVIMGMAAHIDHAVD